MATLLLPDGSGQLLRPADAERGKFTLAELQRAVGGYVEMVKLPGHPERAFLLVDEDGKRKGLPVNGQATRLAHDCRAIWPSDQIVGPALLLTSQEMD